MLFLNICLLVGLVTKNKAVTSEVISILQCTYPFHTRKGSSSDSMLCRCFSCCGEDSSDYMYTSIVETSMFELVTFVSFFATGIFKA